MEQQPQASEITDHNRLIPPEPALPFPPRPAMPAAAIAVPSLRRNFGWTFAGNGLYAAGQWAILSLLAKYGGATMLGEYALALAIATPLIMLSHLNLRTVLATDAANRHTFRDYFAVRLATSAVALAAIAAIAFLTVEAAPLAWIVVVLAIGLAAETGSDLFYGALQRREDMKRIALSMIVRTLLSLAGLSLGLWLARDLLGAVIGLTAARLVVLLVWDARAASTGAQPAATAGGHRAILRQALPLGLVLLLISLNTNLPRYAIEHYLSPSDLGVYAAVASFITIGGTLMNALGQSATSRMARHFHDADLAAFRRLLLRMCGLAAALGLAGILAAVVIGPWILRLLYRPEFAAHHGLLVAAMAAGLCSYLGIALGYGVTSARLFDAQLPLFALSALFCGLASWLLVPRWGLTGAVSALAIATVPQIAGQFLLLRRALSRQEAAS